VKVLVDVNLPPAWTGVLAEHHIAAVHWTSVGDPRAADAELMLTEHGAALESGALVTVDERAARVRVLPIL
jgi:predicted nuclease of predicted toxin-antitoxin system